ncbi:MAG: YdeI/OmpD-associated family protein [Betaproteobacteria bacterium]|nr:YdeI/OmpD-associated family protein [Betaproteobacteria bacterium]
MPKEYQAADFSSEVLVAEAEKFLFARVPPELSKSHLRRGRITARLATGESSFDAQMEPDGKLGHWFVVPPDVAEREKISARKRSAFSLSKLERQPEPPLPKSFKALLSKSAGAQATWESTSTLAKIDWVHWMESAKQEATRKERATTAIDMLEKGKKRVCCFDPSGYFSKALSCPAEANE